MGWHNFRSCKWDVTATGRSYTLKLPFGAEGASDLGKGNEIYMRHHQAILVETKVVAVDGVASSMSCQALRKALYGH